MPKSLNFIDYSVVRSKNERWPPCSPNHSRRPNIQWNWQIRTNPRKGFFRKKTEMKHFPETPRRMVVQLISDRCGNSCCLGMWKYNTWDVSTGASLSPLTQLCRTARQAQPLRAPARPVTLATNDLTVDRSSGHKPRTTVDRSCCPR